MNLSPQVLKDLIQAAKKAQKNAFCDASHYPVGAAVLTSSGNIYAGCNIETPTLINSICAERVAIGNAISHGEPKIKAVCTVSRNSEPCGACRQMIREFSAENAPIISIHQFSKGKKESMLRTSIGELLPNAHTGDMLSSKSRSFNSSRRGK